MDEGGGLENRYPEQSGSWVRIPPSPPVQPIRTFVLIIQKCEGLNFCMSNVIRLEFLSIVIASDWKERGNLIDRRIFSYMLKFYRPNARN